MKLKVLAGAAMLWLVPFMAQASKPLVVKVGYAGQGHYVFKKKTYDHQALVQVIQAKYQDEHIDLVSVDLGEVASVSDRQDVCRLRQELLTQVKMYLTVGDTKQELFCN